jgi:hypothetical protein
MTTWLWVVWLGCGMSPEDAARLEALEAKVAAMEARVDAMDDEPSDQDRQADHDALMERLQARRQERIERLATLRGEREALEAPTDETDGELPVEEEPTLTLAEALADPEAASRMGRALLHRGPDGAFDGYRLSAIRRGTLPDQLGFKNGDTVHEVNGIPMTSMEEAMEAYHAAQKAETLAVKLTRRGEPITLTIDVR